MVIDQNLLWEAYVQEMDKKLFSVVFLLRNSRAKNVTVGPTVSRPTQSRLKLCSFPILPYVIHRTCRPYSLRSWRACSAHVNKNFVMTCLARRFRRSINLLRLLAIPSGHKKCCNTTHLYSCLYTVLSGQVVIVYNWPRLEWFSSRPQFQLPATTSSKFFFDRVVFSSFVALLNCIVVTVRKRDGCEKSPALFTQFVHRSQHM